MTSPALLVPFLQIHLGGFRPFPPISQTLSDFPARGHRDVRKQM